VASLFNGNMKLLLHVLEYKCGQLEKLFFQKFAFPWFIAPFFVVPLLHCTLVLLLPCFVSLLLVSFLAYPCYFVAPLFHYSTFNYFPYLDWYFPFPDLSCKCLSSSFETWNSIQLVSFFYQFFLKNFSKEILFFLFVFLLVFVFFIKSMFFKNILIFVSFGFYIIPFFCSFF
jgi:hypothetical protein